MRPQELGPASSQEPGDPSMVAPFPGDTPPTPHHLGKTEERGLETPSERKNS